jgi:hypothetical protein
MVLIRHRTSEAALHSAGGRRRGGGFAFSLLLQFCTYFPIEIIRDIDMGRDDENR